MATIMNPTAEVSGTEIYDYSQTPKYINHSSVSNDDTTVFSSQDENDNKFTAKDVDGVGIMLNGTKYYSAATVESLLSALESEIKAWATSSFEPKA